MLCETGVTFDIFSKQRVFYSDSVVSTGSAHSHDKDEGNQAIQTKTYDGPDLSKLYLHQIIFYANKNKRESGFIFYHLLNSHIKSKYKEAFKDQISLIIDIIQNKGGYRTIYKKQFIGPDMIPLLNDMLRYLD